MSEEHPALAPLTRPLPGRFAVYFFLFIAAAPIIGYAYWATTEDPIVPIRYFTKQGSVTKMEREPRVRHGNSVGAGLLGGALVTVLFATANELRIRRPTLLPPVPPSDLTLLSGDSTVGPPVHP